MNDTHRVPVVCIADILPHNNADKLEIIRIDGYQCVVQKGTFKPGDLAVYIQPDSVVPQTEPFRFIWGPYAEPGPDETLIEVPERRRRITVRKFRGEYSEGLLLPITDFPEMKDVNVGDDAAELIGITHYDPDKWKEVAADCEPAPKKQQKWPRSLKGWFFYILYKLRFIRGGGIEGWEREYVDFSLPFYDISAYKNHTSAITPHEPVVATEKIHGSNARYVFMNGRMYVGSRTLWKSPKSRCIWRRALEQNPWIEQWCREHEGYTLYGEVVPTQKGFDYGCKKDEVKLFVFDIFGPDKRWLSMSEVMYLLDMKNLTIDRWVPFVCWDVPLDHALKFVDGQSLVPGAKHIREGIVIKPVKERTEPGLGRVILKVVSNKFLEADSR